MIRCYLKIDLLSCLNGKKKRSTFIMMSMFRHACFLYAMPYTSKDNNNDNTKSLLNYCEQCNLVMPMIFTQIIIDRVRKRDGNWICQRNDVAGKNEHRMVNRKKQMNQQITIILHWNPWETFSHGYFLGVFLLLCVWRALSVAVATLMALLDC